jgi:hypothetical protein
MQHPTAFFMLLAAGQVGTLGADTGERRCHARRSVTAPPVGRYAAGDALGLRRVFIGSDREAKWVGRRRPATCCHGDVPPMQAARTA